MLDTMIMRGAAEALVGLTDRIPRPVLTLRVGITGDRSPALPATALRLQVAKVLQSVHNQVEQLRRDRGAQAVYAPDPPTLRFVSPLADGADRIAALAALDVGFALEVIMPFEQPAYEATLRDAASVDEFRTLLAAAGPRVLVLDGKADDLLLEPRSFGAAGRMVVRNCDLLIGIWDDAKPPTGRGGTADTIRFALRAGVPVWWLHASREQPPRWLTDPLDLADLAMADRVQTDAQANAHLTNYIKYLILPPTAPSQHQHKALDRVLNVARRRLGQESDPLRQLYTEVPCSFSKPWRAHLLVMGAIRRSARRWQRRRQGNPLPPPGRKAEAATEGLLESLAVDYQHLYRTSYFFVLILGALALSAAAVGLRFSDSEWVEVLTTGIELVALGSIAALVLWNQLRQWHERYILYRMLRELFRQQDALNALGWTLPGARLSPLRDSRRNWVPWLFAALARTLPLPEGTFGPERLGAVQRQIADGLLGGQQAFHKTRREECTAAAEAFGAIGRGMFLLTLSVVLLKIVLLGLGGPEIARGLTLLTVLLPAASAASFGIRAYEEFEVLAEQSEEMEPALRQARARIVRIDLALPLASQSLGAALSEAAALMLSDVAGWAQLFRVKAVEAA